MSRPPSWADLVAADEPTVTARMVDRRVTLFGRCGRPVVAVIAGPLPEGTSSSSSRRRQVSCAAGGRDLRVLTYYPRPRSLICPSGNERGRCGNPRKTICIPGSQVRVPGTGTAYRTSRRIRIRNWRCVAAVDLTEPFSNSTPAEACSNQRRLVLAIARSTDTNGFAIFREGVCG